MSVPGRPQRIKILKYKLNKFNSHLIAKPSLKFKNIIRRKIDPIEPDQLSSVYEILFTKGDEILQYYKGMSNRKFKTRIKVNIEGIKYNKRTTSSARLHNIEPLQINFKYSKVTHPSKFYYLSIISESIKICMRNEIICNEVTFFKLSGTWHEMLHKRKKII